MNYLPMAAIVLECPNNGLFYFRQNNELYLGRGVKDYKHGQIQITNERKITFVLNTCRLATRNMAHKFNIPVLHPRKVYGGR